MQTYLYFLPDAGTSFIVESREINLSAAGEGRKKTLTKRHKVITPEDYKAESMSVEKIVKVQVN